MKLFTSVYNLNEVSLSICLCIKCLDIVNICSYLVLLSYNIWICYVSNWHILFPAECERLQWQAGCSAEEDSGEDGVLWNWSKAIRGHQGTSKSAAVFCLSLRSTSAKKRTTEIQACCTMAAWQGNIYITCNTSAISSNATLDVTKTTSSIVCSQCSSSGAAHPFFRLQRQDSVCSQWYCFVT